MSLFRKSSGKKSNEIPKVQMEQFEPVLRCSICTGEKVLCLKDRETGAVQELMLIRSDRDLEEFCEANGIAPGSVQKVY